MNGQGISDASVDSETEVQEKEHNDPQQNDEDTEYPHGVKLALIILGLGLSVFACR